MHTFQIFNVFFYFARSAHTHSKELRERSESREGEKKKEKKASFTSGVLLCASPFSQVTCLKVKKSDKFYIPSTFGDYLKERKKTSNSRSPCALSTYHFSPVLMKLIPKIFALQLRFRIVVDTIVLRAMIGFRERGLRCCQWSGRWRHRRLRSEKTSRCGQGTREADWSKFAQEVKIICRDIGS